MDTQTAKLPTVAIVGRPNVGKSSLLNRMVGQRISIVDPTPGVTRDRVGAPCAIGDGYVELVDTGGIGIVDHDDLTEHVEDQIAYGLAEADLLIFVVDARTGVMPLDGHVAERLRRLEVPVILAANKVDEVGLLAETGDLNRLGFGEPIPISAHHGLGIDRLIDRIAGVLGELPPSPPEEAVMKLAIVGKRNAGKSTFINALAGAQRVIVSETPGTTRDSVNATAEIGWRKFMLIDTAGVRKRRRIVQQDIEFYGYHRALRSIRRADVVALMIDASVPVSKVDKDLARDIVDEFKPVLLVVNKWDLARGRAAGEDYQEYFDKVLPELAYAPISLTSAASGMNVVRTIDLAEQLYDQSRVRVTTGQLNVAVREICEQRGPSHRPGTKPPKILYASQISTRPPTIVCFVNDVRSFDNSYQRYFVKQLRQRLPYGEIPIRLLFRARRAHEGSGRAEAILDGFAPAKPKKPKKTAAKQTRKSAGKPKPKGKPDPANAKPKPAASAKAKGAKPKTGRKSKGAGGTKRGGSKPGQGPRKR